MTSPLPSSDMPAPVICIGSALWDVIAQAGRPIRPGYDVPGRITRRMGGVALNVALALSRSGLRPVLLSYVGEDAEGDALIAEMSAAGIDCAFIRRGPDPTDAYIAIESEGGEVFAAVADCAALEREEAGVLAALTDDRLAGRGRGYGGRVIVDGNLPEAVLADLLAMPQLAAAELAFVPASPGKAARLGVVLTGGRATLYVNRREAELITGRRFPDAPAAAAALVAAGACRAVVTDGPNPAADATGAGCLAVTPPVTDAVSTTGAGDVFLATHVGAEIRGADPETALRAAVGAAAAHIRGTPKP